jgi:uncharacterized membrane protein
MSPSPATSLLSEGAFESFAGLPLHPLVVHLVVVVLPLAALLFIVVVVVRKWRRPFDLIALAGLAIGAIGSVLAKESGEALAGLVGQPQQHADWGSILVYLSALLLVVAAIWVFLTRFRNPEGRSLLTTLAAVVGVLLAISAIVMTVLVGHTGAEAVWGRTLATGVVATTPASSASAGPSPSSGPGVTMAEVAQHNSAADCWSAVNGNAYDLTSWIAEHPGGEEVIIELCGTDGTSAFAAQHGGQGEPERELENLLVGPVAD